MKTTLISSPIIFMFIGLLTGCQPDQVPADACPRAGAFVRRVQQVVGTVYYNRARGSYGIQVATSMDSADMGLSCNLPATYQKELTKVRFSGSYYTDDQARTGPAGYRYYYLTVESISLL